MPLSGDPPRAHSRSYDEDRAALAKAVVFGLVGIILVGVVLWVQIANLAGDIGNLRGEIVVNRVVGCQRTIDEQLKLPAACLDRNVYRQLTGAP